MPSLEDYFVDGSVNGEENSLLEEVPITFEMYVMPKKEGGFNLIG